MPSYNQLLDRWSRAELIDPATIDRIRRFEEQDADRSNLRWPTIVALVLGALMVCAGVLLFVAAQWDKLSPVSRFVLVATVVFAFHVAGAFASKRWPMLGMTLHAAGSVSLGAGIFVAGQIFHLEEHWPEGFLLWAIGTAIAWWLLKHDVQGLFTAILVPIWLCVEWIEFTRHYYNSGRVITFGFSLLALVYATIPAEDRQRYLRRALFAIGCIFLIPFIGVLVADAGRIGWARATGMPLRVESAGLLVAAALPMLLAWRLNGRNAWRHGIFGIWLVALFALAIIRRESIAATLGIYGWLVVGALGLIAWGMREKRRGLVNLGIAGFAITVLFFYMEMMMDKLGRSLTLIGFGVIFLLGGWSLERTRRALIARLSG